MLIDITRSVMNVIVVVVVVIVVIPVYFRHTGP